MDDATQKATYINLFLLALADGKIAPEEAAYLKKFQEVTRISDVDAAALQREAQFDRSFRSIGDEQELQNVVKILARMVRVDDSFSEPEQDALISMGKALGLSPDDIGPVLREVWNADPTPVFEHFASSHKTDNIPLFVIDTPAIDKTALKNAAPNTTIYPIKLSAAATTKPAPNIVLFHASDDRVTSKEQLNTLRRALPNSFIAFIARRDQAPQIGLLLEAGADRCFVAPLYPNEIEKAMPAMTSRMK